MSAEDFGLTFMAPAADPPADPVASINRLSAVRSPDFEAYASGQLHISQVRCALCQHAPCDCPEFGTPEYFALIDARHGRNRAGG